MAGKRGKRGEFAGNAARLGHEGWRRFFESHVAQVAARASRFLRLVERLRSSPESPEAVKIVMGVIGRDTVGRSKEIREAFRKLMGVECLGCGEAVEMVSRGVPLERAIGSARLSFRRSEWLDSLTLLERLAHESLRNTGMLETSEDVLRSFSERDYATLVGDPLKVFGMLRGLYASLRWVLPLYSPHAFLVQALRGVPRFAIDKLGWRSHVEVAGRFGLALEEKLPCADPDYSVVSHAPGSTGDMVSSMVDLAYRLHEIALRSSPRRLRVADERRKYLNEALLAVAPLAEMLGAGRELDAVSRTLLNEGRVAGRYLGYRLVEVRIKTQKPARYVTVGRARMGVELFMRGVAPYLVLGLGRMGGFEERGGVEVIFNLSVYAGVG